MNLEILNLSLENFPNSEKKKLNLSLENSPNSALEIGEFSKFILVFEKKTCFRDFVSFESEFGEISKLNPWVWRILQTQPLSVCLLNFGFFFRKKWVWRFWTWKKKYAWRSFFGNKICVQRVFFVSKKTFARIFFFEFGDFLQTQVQNLQLIFFEKKSKFKKYTHSEVEFGEFSKLKGWVWRFPRTQIQKKQNPENMFFFTNQNEFGEFSKLKSWVWRILQTQVLSLENSPNSESKEKILNFF